MTPQELDTPFWRFSIGVYARAGVAAECLALQERFGVDVNLLLFAAYCGAVEAIALDKTALDAAAAAVGDWHADIVRGLRDVRQTLKPKAEDAREPLRDAVAALRRDVKSAELAAEKIEQAMLWRWLRGRWPSPGSAAAPDALDKNLNMLLAHYGASAEATAGVSRLRDATLSFAASKS